MTTSRPLRADAARNRELLLAAAADEFAEHGLDASIADIARRAGIGKGTVFRHFATKDDLIAAILTDRIQALATVGEGLLSADDPADALREFFIAAAHQWQQRDLSFLHKAAEGRLEVASMRTRMIESVQALVDRAREHGVIRPDITAADVILLMCAPTHAAGQLRDAPPELWQRYLAIIFDGLRSDGAHTLPQPPPDTV